MSTLVTDFTIGGFKAFGPEQSVPLRPITLIFGPNSSGKSSLLHSLLWLHNAHRTGSLNAGQVELSGENVDLGDFSTVAHRHDPKQAITFGFSAPAVTAIELSNSDEAIANAYGYPEFLGNYFSYQLKLTFRNESFPVDGHAHFELKPRLTAMEVTSEGETVFRAIRHPDDKLHIVPQCLVNKLWKERVIWGYCDDNELESQSTIDEAREVIAVLINSSLSNSGEPLGRFERFTAKQVIHVRSVVQKVPLKDLEEENFQIFALCLNKFLEPIFSLVPSFLRTLSYLGPLRQLPERDEFRRNRSRRAVEAECWDVLLKDEHVRNSVNVFFGQDFLGTCYKFHRKSFLSTEDSERIDDLVLIDLRTDTRVNLRDVGVGISQIVPVLVHALASKNKTVMIEQPELHIHPALQTELGDVFIRAALGDQQNRFILETHSEHLILRLLRRIRQSTEDDPDDRDWPEGLPRVRPKDISVIYAQPTKEGTTLRPLRITPDGKFEDDWPSGFFTERLKEVL
jgi:hypothetical protein